MRRTLRATSPCAVLTFAICFVACGSPSGRDADGELLGDSSEAASLGTLAPLSAPWTVSGNFLRSGDGRAVVLRGVNLSGKHKNPPYFDFHGPADFVRVRSEWGMNSIRFVMSWAAIEPAKGAFNRDYLDALAQRVEWAKQAGLLVVLDMHQDVFGEGFASGGGNGAPRWACDEKNYVGFIPAPLWTMNYLNRRVKACYDGFWQSADLQTHYAEAWRQVAQRLAAYDNVVGFDVMNEPFWGTHALERFEIERLAPLYERVTAAVRSAAPGWVAFLEPCTSRNFIGASRLPKPSFGNVMYAPHSYDTKAETGNGFDPSRREAILSNLALLWEEAKALGAGLWIGEYGGKASSPGIVEYMTAQYDGMGAVAAGSALWNYTKGGYGLLAEDGSEAQPLANTVVRPFPEAVAGTPLSWAFDAASSTFTFKFVPDRSVSTPTVLSVPRRLYPAGPKVDCNGCTASSLDAAVVITTADTSGPVEVIVHP